MRTITYFLLFALIIVLPLTNAYADKFYRHIPFTILMEQSDKLIVNYDFSEKNGIHCSSNNQVWVNFSYKGHEKSARLPVILQSSHVPQTEYEELADVKGQFSLLINQYHNKTKEYKITCDYAEVKGFK